MNEDKIREIANQASAYAEATITQFDESYDEMPWDAALLKLRDLKFTELIVRDCATKANATALDLRIRPELDAKKYVGDGILKCFGVKE